jgi:ubiquinone/menaquinone biosynthesis C-methylase UbiE
VNPRAESLIHVGAAPLGPARPRANPFSRVLQRAKSLLGLRRRFVVAGVRYTERTFEPLRRALSRKGSGRKDYDVLFPDGSRQRIRATPWRVYADLTPPRLLALYELSESLLRPGMRVLDLACSTGWSADWIARQLGPSGTVVALDRDREAVTYALARYRAGAIAFEQGFVESLSGELDGALSGAIAVNALLESDDAKKTLGEVWRTVAPGGFLLVAQPCKPGSISERAPAFASNDSQLCDLLDSVTGAHAMPLNSPVADFCAALARKAVVP